jgi:hypothetical protein
MTRQAQQAENEKALLAGAKAFLAGQAGVIETARALLGLRNVRPELNDSVMTFVGIDSETDTFPLDEVRKLWAPDALARLDPKIAADTEHYREYIRKACEQIVSVLEPQA